MPIMLQADFTVTREELIFAAQAHLKLAAGASPALRDYAQARANHLFALAHRAPVSR